MSSFTLTLSWRNPQVQERRQTTVRKQFRWEVCNGKDNRMLVSQAH
ncbi:hypothetical protein TorRG33x02_280360 [Trema orientale]|uniref:Uncharacterized protein n=1 Tax=Trema orientale TaxID=63057 RepID=A0A2P5CLZ0_TREOI|nr:hypothetical protein TorRG33x02_280360 [Trema orientale]